MDFVVELVGEIVSAIFDVVFASKKVKIRVKTGLFLLISLFVEIVIFWCGVSLYQEENRIGGMVVGGIGVVLGVFFLIGGIRNHKKGWLKGSW